MPDALKFPILSVLLMGEACHFDGLITAGGPLEQENLRRENRCRCYNFCDFPQLSIPYRV
jgi:hypothetical protein